MNYVSLIINVAAIMAGLALYIVLVNSKWGKSHENFQYAIMLAAIMFAVLVGGFVRWLM